MSLKILRPGLLTTVQDAGRHGLQHLGVAAGGAIDTVAFVIANALVGNERREAALEITLLGPELEVAHDTLVALCGAPFEATANGRTLPCDRPVLLKAGTRLATGRARRGTRAYLAVAGGIAVAPVLGSRSTYLPARFGGVEGRALRAGDLVPLAADSPALSQERFERLASRANSPGGLNSVRWSAPALTLPEREPVVLHALAGRHHAEFDVASRRAFHHTLWRISPDSNRMGFRLTGAALARPQGGEILSEPTCLGTVQVPASGAPIVLMADRQTTGGYPRIAEVASADVPRLAQLAPGATLRFGSCTLEQALELRRALGARLDTTLRAISWEYGG